MTWRDKAFWFLAGAAFLFAVDVTQLVITDLRCNADECAPLIKESTIPYKRRPTE